VRRDPYQVFSRVYDQDVHLEIPRAFFRAVRPLVRAARGGPPVLDLGCGTGLVTERIAADGCRVIGVDGSRPMLALARRRCAPFRGRVRLLHRRLDALRLAPEAGLALACGDVINHLPSLRLVERVLRAARRALAPGGLLVFDALTDFCFETYWPDNTHLLEGPHGDLLMDCDWDPVRRRGTARMIAFAREGRGRFRRQETTLHEYAWRDRELARALRAAGFADVWRRPWSAWPDQDREPAMDRNLWCGRNGEGDAGARPARLRALGFRRVPGSGPERVRARRSRRPPGPSGTERPRAMVRHRERC
jgi:SAM-dependent methyltransferase